MKTVIFRYFLFVYVCAESLFLSGLSLVAASTGYSWLQHSDLSLQRLLLPQSADSRVHMLSSCAAWAWLLLCMWNLPRPGIEPMSPALAGRFYPLCHQGSPVRYS